MVFDQIDELKRRYTDKYVMVDAQRPELARFRDTVGRVKTVNMNGQALVEFDDYHLNIGWYDIDPQFLKVVDKPPPRPKEEPKKEAPAKKAPGEAASAAGAKAPAKPAVRPGGKPSVADILAAARGGAVAKTPAAGADPAKPKGEPASAGGAAASAKVDRSKMSVADMIAAAKAGGAKGSAPAAAKLPEAKAQAEPEPPAEEAEGEPASAGGETATTAKAPSGETIDKKSMSIADMIAWCKAHDTK